jgi:hypothetical protein
MTTKTEKFYLVLKTGLFVGFSGKFFMLKFCLTEANYYILEANHCHLTRFAFLSKILYILLLLR